jgi:glycosyltransferase involved in cell wall biosynthesis
MTTGCTPLASISIVSRTDAPATPRVSVVIPFRGRRAFLDECLAHLERQTFRDFDIYLVPDEPLNLAGPRLRVIVSGAVLPNRKRQIAAEASTSEILAFIDDDAYPDPDWLTNAVRHFADPDVVGAGGPAVTATDNTPLQRASGAIFSSALVTATTRHRYVAEVQRDVGALASCNLLVRRTAFLRDAEASVRYWPGEDILLCMFAARDGARIVYDPTALVYHHRRAVFAGHLRQVWAYGRFRGFFLRRLSTSRSDATYAVPAAFVLGHGLLLAALAQPRWRFAAGFVVGVYAALVAWEAVRAARAERADPWLVAAGIYLTHLTYGAGTIVGWLRGSARRPHSADVTPANALSEQPAA